MVITHDRDIAARMGRRIDMLDGQIISDSAEKSPAVTDAGFRRRPSDDGGIQS